MVNLEREHKIAFARVITDLIEADFVVEADEMRFFESVISKDMFAITETMLAEAKTMDFSKALSILKGLDGETRRLLLGTLKQLSMSDGVCVPLEAILIFAVEQVLLNGATLHSIPQSRINIDNLKVLYIENEETAIGRQIEENLSSIVGELKIVGFDFVYIPSIVGDFARMEHSYLKKEKGKRQTLLFSATLEDRILTLASGWLADPVIYESEPEKMVSENITQTFYSVLREEKLALILYILRTMDYERLIIFGNRKDVNLRLQYDLARYGYDIPVLSGDITQAKRIKILERFRSGKERVVIATDVAARGIHVDDISLVINYDLPEQPEDYIHRIGRTGRAGHRGTAISFLCEYGAYYLPAIEELLGSQFSSILPTEEMLQLPEPVKNPKIPERDENAKSSRPHHRDGNRRNNRFRR